VCQTRLKLSCEQVLAPGGGLVGMLIIEDAADEVPADLQARGYREQALCSSA